METDLSTIVSIHWTVPIVPNGETAELPNYVLHKALEALQMGLIKQRCDVGCALGTATTLARSLTKFSQANLLNDKNSTYLSVMQDGENKLAQYLLAERLKGLDQFSKSPPLEVAVKFLKGEACRHGRFNLNNMQDAQPECTV